MRARSAEERARHRRPLRRLLALLPAVSLAGLLAACGTTSKPAVQHSQPAPGGTATYALQATDAFSWMLPFENSANEEPWDLSTDEGMWRPLYFEGSGSKPVINQKLSLAYPPVYSANDTVVTIRLKPYRWSDGAPVTARDVQFSVNLYRAGEADIATYVPGNFPDDITSLDVVSPTELVLHLNRPYSQEWFTDNQLVNLIPLPQQAWDRTSANRSVGNFDETPAGAKAVFTFLEDQSKQLATYATNPLWRVVDGPWIVTRYDAATGQTELTANRAYSGPEKPRLDHVILETFTSDTAEVDALRSGSIDYGWIPYSDLGLESYFRAHGFTVAPWAPDYYQSAELGYTSPVYGPLLRQLYVRQALQHLVDDPLDLATTLHGIGQLTYGPAPNIPGSPWVSPEEKTDPDPYSVSAARELLRSHGWTPGAGGTLVCSRPGTGPNECGPGIARDKPLRLLMNYTTGSASVAAQAGAFQTAAAAAGVDVVLAPESATTMFSTDGVCPSSPPCNFAIALYPLWFTNYGDMSILPTGGQQFGPGNYYGGGYSSATADRLIQAAHEHTGLRYLYADEDFLSRQVAALWFPTGDNQISVVRDRLRGWEPQNPFGNPRPSRWYFVR